MSDTIKELLAGLPAEIQEELKEVQTQDEIMAVLNKHAIPLPDEALELVAGGFSWAEVKPV
ncbi:MAG: hypothetical protein PUD82_04915 [Coriobacteriaceae bacterium]|nr:hypothetical protein [Coriobacteriaceae bacterium]